MNVFISWSGATSHGVAQALDGWLPRALAFVRPWMSARSIDLGSDSFSQIADALDTAHVAIVCITRDNVESRWMHFEAGAVAKTMGSVRGRVIPYVFAMPVADVGSPLGRFQGVQADRRGTHAMLSALNDTLGADSRLDRVALAEVVDVWWPRLEAQLALLPETSIFVPDIRSDRQLLEEALSLLRQGNSGFAHLESWRPVVKQFDGERFVASALLSAAEESQVVQLNPYATLQSAILTAHMVLTSEEFDVVVNNVTYVAQRAERPVDGLVSVFFINRDNPFEVFRVDRD